MKNVVIIILSVVLVGISIYSVVLFNTVKELKSNSALLSQYIDTILYINKQQAAKIKFYYEGMRECQDDYMYLAEQF